ncbi:hypothetical protein [Candidatus Phycosocius bacilliformis]|uniref:hypothetical protein n=1 Tax=Candidatus Phycosocius bacilliformis TaxID=1445552 RepID=UPI000D59B3ED|nr:hypothetical protein [Candidatus Phycosocius bacilliformis]
MTQLDPAFSGKLAPVAPQRPQATHPAAAQAVSSTHASGAKWSWQQTILFALVASGFLWGMIFWAVRALIG